MGDPGAQDQEVEPEEQEENLAPVLTPATIAIENNNEKGNC